MLKCILSNLQQIRLNIINQFDYNFIILLLCVNSNYTFPFIIYQNDVSAYICAINENIGIYYSVFVQLFSVFK